MFTSLSWQTEGKMTYYINTLSNESSGLINQLIISQPVTTVTQLRKKLHGKSDHFWLAVTSDALLVCRLRGPKRHLFSLAFDVSVVTSVGSKALNLCSRGPTPLNSGNNAIGSPGDHLFAMASYEVCRCRSVIIICLVTCPGSYKRTA